MAWFASVVVLSVGASMSAVASTSAPAGALVVPEPSPVQPSPVQPAGGLPPLSPVPSLPPIEVQSAASARLVPVPAGCAAPDVEQAVFIGTLVINDAVTARYSVEQVRSGTVEGFSVGGLIDVRYGDEVRFLEVGRQYIVGAAIDTELRVLASSVRASAPLFGGNEIAGVDDSDVECPRLESPVRTLLADGTSVDTGVLSPLSDAKGDVVRAILQPIGVALAVLFGLVVVKHLFFALGRSLRDLGSTDRPRSRERQRPNPTAPDRN